MNGGAGVRVELRVTSDAIEAIRSVRRIRGQASGVWLRQRIEAPRRFSGGTKSHGQYQRGARPSHVRRG